MEKHVDKTNYRDALKNVVADPKVNIKIAKLTGNDSFSLYVTEIPANGKVGAHFHKEGLETYEILSGKGMMYIGTPLADNAVEWHTPVEVNGGDFFTIPNGMVHQLKNPFEEKLVLVFGCPESHLGTDRTIVQEKSS